MLRKQDWDIQKPCIILFVIHKLVQRKRATKPETTGLKVGSGKWEVGTTFMLDGVTCCIGTDS